MFGGNVVQTPTDQLFFMPSTNLFFQSIQASILLSAFRLLVAIH